MKPSSNSGTNLRVHLTELYSTETLATACTIGVHVLSRARAVTNEILHRFSNLKIYTRRGSKAPNKPLLALWAIGRCLRGLPRLAEYGLVDRELSKLLMRFGPPRQIIHTEQLFWRMQGDDVWEIDRPELVKCTKKKMHTRRT